MFCVFLNTAIKSINYYHWFKICMTAVLITNSYEEVHGWSWWSEEEKRYAFTFINHLLNQINHIIVSHFTFIYFGDIQLYILYFIRYSIFFFFIWLNTIFKFIFELITIKTHGRKEKWVSWIINVFLRSQNNTIN